MSSLSLVSSTLEAICRFLPSLQSRSLLRNHLGTPCPSGSLMRLAMASHCFSLSSPALMRGLILRILQMRKPNLLPTPLIFSRAKGTVLLPSMLVLRIRWMCLKLVSASSMMSDMWYQIIYQNNQIILIGTFLIYQNTQIIKHNHLILYLFRLCYRPPKQSQTGYHSILINQSYLFTMKSEHQNLSMREQFEKYRAIPEQTRISRIRQAKQLEENRKPNPQKQDDVFSEEGFIKFTVMDGEEQINLHTYREPAQGPNRKALLFMVHGMGSHMTRGAHIAKFFSRNGYEVVGYDQRGAGKSEGKKGIMGTLEQHLADSRKFIDLVLPLYGKMPKFILGQSLGGMTSYFLTLREPDLFLGNIMMSPALKNNVPGWKKGLLNCLDFITPRKLLLPRPSVPGMGTKNPQVSADNQGDKLKQRGWFSVATLQTVVGAMDAAKTTFKDYKAPFLIVQGGLDKVVHPLGALQLYQECATPQQDKHLIFYEGMWHDVWHEQEIWPILDESLSWIQKRLQKIVE